MLLGFSEKIAPPKKKVSVNWNTLYVFIPLVTFWAYWRIGEFWSGIGLGIMVSFIMMAGMIPIMILVGMEDELGSDNDWLLYFILVGFGLGIFLKIRYSRKWTRDWNEKIENP
jgi:hypothetical protein